MASCYLDENGNDPKADREVNDQHILAKAGIRPLAAANCTDYVVAHSDSGIRPVRQFSEVALLPPILEAMQKLGLNRLLRVQSHSWPHLAASRGHGAMIVAAPRSGRTFSYIPPVCDVVRRGILDAKCSDFDNALDLLGPLAVILVPDLERVRQVASLCYAFLRKATLQETYTLTLTVPSVMKPEFFHRLFNGVGCLVATPAQLVWAMEDSLDLLPFPHLQVLVYDDVDLMQPELLERAEQMLKRLVPKDRSYPQLVMVSQSYDPRLMAKLRLWNSNPSLIFGDILEAALYGQTRLRIALWPEQDKVQKVYRMLEKRPPSDYRTVIFCSNDADMRRLVGLLGDRYGCLPYYQDSTLEVGERVHRWLAESRGLILLATDDCPELNIRHAHTLIHYSMSTTWGKFKMRHLFISGNLLPKEEQGLSLHSLVLLDDSNQKQLPRLVDFLEKHQKVDAAVVAVAKHIRQETARSESANQNVVCRQIMELGDCISPSCDERHFVGRLDRAPPSVPTSGDVKVRLVRVYSPTHFCVHLLEHLPPASKSWQAYPSLAVTHMNLQLLQPSKSERYWPPLPGGVCLYHRSNTGRKDRVRVLKVAPIKNVNLANLSIEVWVQALDVDTRIFRAKSGSLYACPEELQVQPPMALDLRLLGMVPFSGERSWSEEDRLAIEYKLEHLPQDHFLQAIIQFATSHTLFVRNMMAITYASAMKMHVRRLNLCQHLTEEKMAKSCEQAKEKIVAFFGDGEGEKPEELSGEEVKVKEQHAPEETNNNDPPKPILKGRLLRLAELGRESGRLNRLAREQEQESKARQQEQELKAKKEEQEAEALKEEQEAEALKEEQNDGMAQLYRCVMNCALQERQEETLPENERLELGPSFNEFLEVLQNQGKPSPSAAAKPRKSKKKAKPEPKAPLQIPGQLPPNVVRPPTTYYQTKTTLELQVLLPDEGYQYHALLADNQLLFVATCQASTVRQQFVLNLNLAYSSLSHHPRGRTVYISVKKTVAMVDPLAFHAYQRFLKANHDMFGKLEEEMQARVLDNIERYTRLGKAMPLKREEAEDEESSEEERNMDGIERGDAHQDCED